MLRRATSPTRAVRDTPWGGGDWATGGDQSGDLAAAAVGDCPSKQTAVALQKKTPSL